MNLRSHPGPAELVSALEQDPRGFLCTLAWEALHQGKKLEKVEAGLIPMRLLSVQGISRHTLVRVYAVPPNLSNAAFEQLAGSDQTLRYLLFQPLAIFLQ